MKKSIKQEASRNLLSDFQLKSQEAYLRDEITLGEKNKMNKIAYSAYQEMEK